ncbi:UxaA family hydrolase [Spongiimicrobium sp. 3-5]|uniref:UxaA family hydrolase n=1 Tax=Spongiimicrobium sp. 3-5 TaxID=3332596 RepID=UPI00397F2019
MQLDERDNIAVALKTLPKGMRIPWGSQSILLKEDIAQKHKFTLKAIPKGETIIMYGTLVGRAVSSIAKGAAIRTDNTEHAAADYKPMGQRYSWQAPDISRFKNSTFNGYHRKDGSVGTANYWLVIPLVFCENRNVDIIKSSLLNALGYNTSASFIVDAQVLVEKYKRGESENDLLATDLIKNSEEIAENRTFPNVDGIKFLNHDGGCGGIRQDSETLCNLLAGYITHPNVAGATILSLGCQNAQVSILKDAIQKKDSSFAKPLYVLEQQQSASERHFIEEAVKKTFLGLIEANKNTRQKAPLGKLTLGLECGGSDGFSGITANPTLGYASDLLVGLGGTTVLAEFPELNGVEQELINRCHTETEAIKFSNLMKAYSQKAVAVGSGFENNPSPGNIKDGLITDAMKSAGAAKKAGSSPVIDVLDYTEKITKKGLNLLCTPGNDVESTTGLAGSGCNIIAFTTGLGTPTGNPVAPVIKISSNSKLGHRMKDIIDFDTGSIISGEDSVETLGVALLEYIIKVASGEEVPAAVRLGQEDFIPWKRGISL